MHSRVYKDVVDDVTRLQEFQCLIHESYCRPVKKYSQKQLHNGIPKARPYIFSCNWK